MKIISGGQTGADIGALIAAKLYRLETGGFMPNGWRTHDGPRPQYKELFGMVEHPMKSYKARTYANVEQSDGTLRIACNFDSAGEKCTLNAIKTYQKPSIDITVDRNNPIILSREVRAVRHWIYNNNIWILNVAGNSHKTYKFMQSYVVHFMSSLFVLIGFDRLPLDARYNFLATNKGW